MKKILFWLLSAFICVSLITLQLNAQSLGSKTKTNNQQKLTKYLKTKNGIKVLYRKSKSSPIFRIAVNYKKGTKDYIGKDDIGFSTMMSLMPYSTKSKTKEQIDKIKEKYSLYIGCGGSLEYSQCGLTTTDDHWKQGIELLTEVMLTPAFDKKGFETNVARTKSALEATPQDPESYVNSVLNKVYYGKNHPYASDYKESLFHLKSLKISDLKKLHSVLNSSNNIFITVVSSVPEKEVMNLINQKLGHLRSFPSIPKKVTQPEFQPKNSYAFEHRDIPTAYIKFKFNLPLHTSKETPAIKLMLRVMSKILTEEVRNKRSLSYSVYSYAITNSIGIGVMGVSTSKPKETLEVMQNVVDTMKNKKLTQTQLGEYKPVFKTYFYKSLESQGAFESSLTKEIFYSGKVDSFYNFTDSINKITPEDIQNVAKKYLKNFRIGTIFHKDKFKESWAKNFINHFKK